MEPVDRKTVLLATVATFAERRKTEDMPKGLVEDRADVVAERNNSAAASGDRSQA